MSGSAPPPQGANQAFLGPSLWIVDGQPTPQFFELVRALWLRTGGVAAPTDGSAIGISALQKQVAALQNEVAALTGISLLAITEGGVVGSAAEITNTSDAELLAVLGLSSPVVATYSERLAAVNSIFGG